jgi:hypothetical protein
MGPSFILSPIRNTDSYLHISFEIMIDSLNDVPSDLFYISRLFEELLPERGDSSAD